MIALWRWLTITYSSQHPWSYHPYFSRFYCNCPLPEMAVLNSKWKEVFGPTLLPVRGCWWFILSNRQPFLAVGNWREQFVFSHVLHKAENSFLHREQLLSDGGVLGSILYANDSYLVYHHKSDLFWSLQPSSLSKMVFLNTWFLIYKIPALEFSSKFLLREMLMKIYIGW